jgi:hypothetical protein
MTDIVCDMTSAPDSGAERLEEYARLFAAAYLDRERTAGGGVRWRLRAYPGIETWARDLAERENACCAFMTTTVTVDGGQVLWESVTIHDPAAHAVLDLLYELPTTPPADAREGQPEITRISSAMDFL